MVRLPGQHNLPVLHDWQLAGAPIDQCDHADYLGLRFSRWLGSTAMPEAVEVPEDYVLSAADRELEGKVYVDPTESEPYEVTCVEVRQMEDDDGVPYGPHFVACWACPVRRLDDPDDDTLWVHQVVGAELVDAFGAYDLRDTGDVLGYATGVMEGRISLFTNWRP